MYECRFNITSHTLLHSLFFLPLPSNSPLFLFFLPSPLPPPPPPLWLVDQHNNIKVWVLNRQCLRSVSGPQNNTNNNVICITGLMQRVLLGLYYLYTFLYTCTQKMLIMYNKLTKFTHIRNSQKIFRYSDELYSDGLLFWEIF